MKDVGWRRVVKARTGATALLFGAGVAWIDARPNWDDTGITAGLLVVVSGVAAALGLRWWHAAILVALPLVIVEYRTAGWGIAIVLGFTTAGGAMGTALRSAAVPIRGGGSRSRQD